jgi:palmitoyl-protein thioesterase
MRSSLVLSLATTSAALNIQSPPSHNDAPLPLIIWHGLGDRYDADGMHSIGALAESIHPGTFVYYVRTDDDSGQDRTNTFFGDLNEQLDGVCAALQAVPELRQPHTGDLRVDALGFSQGGQFLRGLVERCEPLSVRTLMTYGSQHNGIAGLRPCGTWDLLCKGATGLMKGNVWSDYVQSHVVPAQYYRTLDDATGLPSDEYLEKSGFLADINNERVLKNASYAERIAALEKFVMVVFEEDTTVIPRESGWFAEVNGTSGVVTPLQERPIYLEDWIGLKALGEKDGLVFLGNPGDHMQLDEKVLKATFKEYFGAETRTKARQSKADL